MRTRCVMAFLQWVASELIGVLPFLQTRRLDPREGDPVHPRCAPVGAGERVGVAQDIRAMDLVVEQVEAEGRLRLRLAIKLPLESPDRFGCLQAHRQSPLLLAFGSAPEVRVLPAAGVTRPQRYRDPVRRPPGPPPDATVRPRPSSAAGLPR